MWGRLPWNFSLNERPLVERHADPLFARPHRVATTHELIGLDDERERLRQPDGTGDV
jgi:hypothetical protein